jgi:hypothetical protein
MGGVKAKSLTLILFAGRFLQTQVAVAATLPAVPLFCMETNYLSKNPEAKKPALHGR